MLFHSCLHNHLLYYSQSNIRAFYSWFGFNCTYIWTISARKWQPHYSVSISSRCRDLWRIIQFPFHSKVNNPYSRFRPTISLRMINRAALIKCQLLVTNVRRGVWDGVQQVSSYRHAVRAARRAAGCAALLGPIHVATVWLEKWQLETCRR